MNNARGNTDATLVAMVTCTTEGHFSTHVNKTVIYCIRPFLRSKPIRVLPQQFQPVPSFSQPPSLSVSLTFIFSLIELNMKIMSDIKFMWTCGLADRCVCLFFHSKCLLCLSLVFFCFWFFFWLSHRSSNKQFKVSGSICLGTNLSAAKVKLGWFVFC